jgi:sporulation protein YlmC with PRC-barrel domain
MVRVINAEPDVPFRIVSWLPSGASRSWIPSGGTFGCIFRSRLINNLSLEDTMKRFAAAALLSAAIIGGPAYAQNTQPADRTAPTATASQAAGSKMMLKGNWRASKLMGLDVYNEANEKLGDVNELILDKDGKINAVVIGVGGFLGMGEHDIAVSMDKLKFVETPVRTSSTAPTGTAPTGTVRDTTTGTATAPANTTTTTTTARNADANDWTPDHAVMSGTKDQLKAMPQFKYSDYN